MTVEFRQNSNSEYHSDLHVISSSMLNVLIGDGEGDFCEDAFFKRFVARSEPNWNTARHLDIGSATHLAALEPHRFSAEVAVMPQFIKRRSGKMWRAFEAENRDKIILSRSELQAVTSMKKSLRDAAGSWLDADGITEKSMYWTDHETGLRLRCRPDKIIRNGKVVLIIDIKTTYKNTAESFSSSFRKFNYGVQEAHYSDGIREWCGIEPQFRFVVVQSSGDYCAKRFESTLQQKESSRLLRRRALNRLAELYSSDWKSVA